MSEKADINFRPIWRGIVITVVALIAIEVLVWAVFRLLSSTYGARDVSRALVAPEPQKPSEPLLQVGPQLEWKQVQQNQMNTLSSYGWISREQGRVRIPIERAMDKLVEQSK